MTHESTPAVSDPAVSDPAVSDPAVSDPAVSDPAVSDPAGSAPTGRERDAAPDLHRLEGQLARLEAQVRAHSERLAELDQSARSRKQQGLMLRLFILALALGAFFFLKMRAGA